MTGVDARRQVPRTDAVLGDPVLADALERFGRAHVKQAVTDALDRVRAGDVAPGDAAADAARALRAREIRAVINATGVVLHTNLGRAALSPAARTAVDAAAGYADVEYDLDSGRRARRGRAAIDALRTAVPDAGDVHVVNNGAAALLLATSVLAGGREAVISRGEMVEIGDGFRLPDLIASGGVRLREVGTTNRVTLDDYRAAISENTAVILKIHPSNFTVSGFTGAVEVRALATLGVPVIADIGSGLLAPDPLLPNEPDATTALRAGASVVTCSGDKLLGGPQAGLLLGDAGVVERLRRHPLARALRVDKLTLAALAATVAGPAPPTWRYLRADAEVLRDRCERLAAALGGDVAVVAVDGVVGGGGAPDVTLAGWALSLPARIAERLRRGDPPVIARVDDGRCLVDLRCVEEADDAVVAGAIIAAG